MTTSQVFEKAIRYAAKKHKGQTRKGNGAPYILHPMSVVLRVKEAKDSRNMFLLGAAAILHDLVEDCGVSLNKIAKKFGMAVAAIVDELTIDKKMMEAVGKTKYLSATMIDMSSYSLTIKLCDRLDNLCDMDDMSHEFKESYVRQTQAIIQAIEEGRILTSTHQRIIGQIKEKLREYMFHPSVNDGLGDGPQEVREQKKLVDKTGNQINTIYPYRTKGGWAFDDEEVGLKAEPFIAGIPQIIDSIVGKRNEFIAHISHSSIPSPTGKLKKIDAPKKAEALEGEDGWYQLEGTDMTGWLCPALLKYFKGYPDEIYFKIE